MGNTLLGELTFIEASVQIHRGTQDGSLSEHDSYMSVVLFSQCVSVLL